MADIKCWECGGAGKRDVAHVEDRPCYRCGTTGRTEDRRAATANDRAVERIKAFCSLQVSGDPTTEYLLGTTALARLLLNIIEQEADNG